MNPLYKNNSNRLLVALMVLMTCGTTAAGQQAATKNQCYSAYQLEQKLALSVVLGDSIQKQNIYLKMDIHTREVATSAALLSQLQKHSNYSAEEIRSYVMLLKPQQNKVDGNAMDFVQRYQHPFIVNIDQSTGELIKLDSTTEEKSVIKEYLGFSDLFQYSKNIGDYLYRNGNGRYNAHLAFSNDANQDLLKTNVGYLDGGPLKIKRNKTQMKFAPTGAANHCFYQSASATETFTNTLSKQTYMRGDAIINIAISNQGRLPHDHFFHSLTSDITQWPSFKQQEIITQQQAFERLPELFSQLKLLTDDKMAFLTLFKSEKTLWPFLADFMQQDNSQPQLVDRVIWSLNRINNTESVSALLNVSMSDIPSKNVYRSILALITSSAEINQQTMGELINYLSDFKYSDNNSQQALLLLRSLGALAKHRDQHAPMQSQEIKQYLYSQLHGSSDQFKASIYESIGAMGKSIDREGIQLLLQGLSESQTSIKESAINGLTKIPYQKDHSDLYIAELESEHPATTKDKLIELLAKADKDDQLVKDKLLSIVNKPTNFSQTRKSIAGLKAIDFELNESDVEILESRLRKETDKASQMKLASLILKHRRQ